MKRVLAIMLAAVLCGCSKKEEPPKDDYVFAPVTNACRLIGILVNAAVSSKPPCPTNVVTRIIDTRGMDASAFRNTLEEFPGRQVQLWMPGENRWLLVGLPTTNRVSLALAMERLAADESVVSVPNLFASYVGTREEIMPAFASKLEGDVVPQWFVTREIPELKWLDTTGIDGDILKATLADIRSMQVVRRLVLEGDILTASAKDKKSEEEAIDRWTRAMKRNPEDTMLLERLNRLERNAKGFMAVGKVLQAMKCYETMVLVRPDDAVAIHNFGACLKKIGKVDLAAKVLKRADELAKAKARREGTR